ncbi:RNA polymerase sigma factor [Pedobacter sp. MC2016-24]|uniref:RNA polymerase sigma factor n=1 Tax=Pedobacter sp. MC2016-24 TaxID=2780090 RepID=UPI001880D053|nr:sigma-70 family RNA polymerase sigma factor [Pedobacter sp. MC2016-24]MBE9599511.1 sigma-70 family RNA polymerase sigma factor [Pedobacter sp. MC2016-24]
MNAYRELSEKQLIYLLQKKDLVGFKHLYTHYYTGLFNITKAILKDQELAEDVLQLTFTKIWCSAAQYTPQRGRLFTWMLNIARNNALDVLRSKSYKNSLQNLQIDGNPDMYLNIIEAQSQLVLSVDGIDLWSIVRKLNVKDYEVLELAYRNGLTHKEIASLLEMPMGTVKTKLRNALIAVRKSFEKDIKIYHNIENNKICTINTRP